jgi:hypothetical protein
MMTSINPAVLARQLRSTLESMGAFICGLTVAAFYMAIRSLFDAKLPPLAEHVNPLAKHDKKTPVVMA